VRRRRTDARSVVIDTGSPREEREETGGDDLEGRIGVACAEFLSGAPLVRILDTIETRGSAQSATERRSAVGTEGERREAVAIAARLTREAGFDPVIVGGLSRAREFDRGTPVYVRGMTGKELREALNLPPDS